VAVATYPGTVSPLRGLDPFGEAERDVWHGRESERDDIAKMVIAEGFRAGLLFGEPGVGKTSLVRAGLIPHLRDHGIVALACEDISQPAGSFAVGLSAFGIQPTAGEQPIAFLTRAVGAAVQGQRFVFVIDDIDALCADERATQELSDIFSKVVSRSAGRARFLFVCASERMHMLGALERRTGSLFPPSTRYELGRLAIDAASDIFDRMLSLSGVAADPQLAHSVVQAIGHGQPVLAADLQIAAMAMRDLRLSTAATLHKAGGPTELESLWLHDACKSTGNERSGLRLCAELASSGAGPRTAESIVRRVNLDAGYAQQAFVALEQRGVIIRADGSGQTWMLRHEILTQRIRELTAPARAAARAAFDLLGSKTANKERLKLGELVKLRSQGIAAITAEERSVVQRSKRYYMTIAGIVAAIPIIILIIILFSMKGRVYFDETPKVGGDHVVVRGGRAGLHGFFWLPGGWGNLVADTGLTRAMVAPEAWKKIESHDWGNTRGLWEDDLPSIMAPQLAGLVDYATTGNAQTLDGLKKAAKDPEDLAELLTALRPIARGTAPEVAIVEAALKTPSPAVQRAAIAAAGSAASRRSDVYQDTLAKALVSTDPELRRIAFATVRSLGDAGRPLFTAALSRDADTTIKHELMAEASTTGSASETPGATAAAVLSGADSLPLSERAKMQLKGALVQDPAATAAALGALLADEKALIKNRTTAIEMLRDIDPAISGKVKGVPEAAHAAFTSKLPEIRNAALPLYARLDPVRASNELGAILDDKKADKGLRAAAALAWGEVASVNKDAAANALDKLLKDDDNEVRAGAATAAGRLGRPYQDRLVKMAKAESYIVRLGAARGLAVSAEVGANIGYAVDGIAQMWREKGSPRRDAVKVWAHMAKKKPVPVLEYLSAAAKMPDDPALHPLAIEGLCNASFVGSTDARKYLARSTDEHESLEVRRMVMQCVAYGPDPGKNGVLIAERLGRDQDPEIRADAARVLAAAAASKGGKVAGGIIDTLVGLLNDNDKDVRLIAIRAIGGLAGDVPKSAGAAMVNAFDRGDEAERIALVRTARSLGGSELGAPVIDRAIAMGQPLVRVEAVDAALTANLNAGSTLSAALADPDPGVRKAALERIAAQKDKLDATMLDRALSLAVRDPNPELSQLALTTYARVAQKDAVVKRLHRALASRAERERVQAAAAAIGLVDRDAALATQLLEPLLDDASHDVRAAMLPGLAAAYAKTNTPDKLVDILTDSEDNAQRRLVAAAAFVTLARTDVGKKASEAVLAKVVDSGPAMARQTAKLTAGLIENKADGMAFLQELVP
jgi:HEAT repeat protein